MVYNPLLNLLLIPYLSLASRWHGGGFFKVRRIIKASVFALPYLLFNPFAFLFALVGKGIGHEDFWMMGTKPARPDKNWLCELVLLTGLKRDSLSFCTVGMAAKGLITALGTLNPLVILGHMVALPLSYWIGRHTKYGTELAEYLSGALYGAIIVAGI